MAKSHISAWREILTRIFEGLTVEYNVSPLWLINPTTKRRLKLDLLYPEIGVAIRFAGLRGSQQRGRTSLTEQAQQKMRDSARDEISENHGISLAILDIAKQEPEALFQALEMALSRATRRLDKDTSLSATEKSARRETLMRVRGTAGRFKQQIKTEKDLSLYFDLWRDRQFRESGTSSSPEVPPTNELPPLAEGMIVEHSHFGSGIIQTITPGDTDANTLITIHFENAGERTFLATLLADKLTISSPGQE